MIKTLRVLAAAMTLASLACLYPAVSGPGGGTPAAATAMTTAGPLTCRLNVREKLISGAYKVYGLKDKPVGVWLAKTLFRNTTGGPVEDLKVRYKLGQYADWCPWQTYPKLVPTQTVVDLYHPILSSECAKLTSRTPAELQMQCRYRDATGSTRTMEKSQRLTILSRREFYFTNLSSQERTGAFQDVCMNAPLLAAWVTSSDTPVTGLAGLANEMAKGAGANTKDESCLAVMRELYEIMRTIKITYQSPAHQVEQDKTFDAMLVQTLQYPRDTVRKRSGTCIDLTILYAAMMQSVGIKPLLVTLDGHCFPMGVTPGGKFVPVEATGVGGGGRNSMSFPQAVATAQKEWQDLRKTGRFIVVDCQQCWGAGISPPELAALPADILDRWKINEQVRGAAHVVQPPAHAPAAPARTGGQAATAPLAAGTWAFRITQLDGRNVPGEAQITVSGRQVQLVAVLAYQVAGYDGRAHQAREQNTFVGTISGQRLTAQCRQATWTLDGQAVQPQGLPYTLSLTVAPNGRGAQGTVSNSMGLSTQIVMQAK